MRGAAFAVVSLFFVVAVSAGAQQTRELLQPVDTARSLRLEEYNSAFLRDATYFASRYRIVAVDPRLLSQAQEITVTPFDDVEPIQLVPVSGTPRRLGENHIYWTGSYKQFAPFEALGIRVVTVTIAANAWDVGPSGDAAISSAFNPRSFYSVDAVFDVPGGSRYVLQALRYTPKYSAIYEIPRDTLIPVRIDIMPGDPPPSAEERASFERYRRFVEARPDESGKPIRGDMP